MIGGFKFYERKEVKEVLTFLHFLVKKDDYSFKRIINIPAKGIGPKSISNFQDIARQNHCSIWEAIDAEFIKHPAKLVDFIEHTRSAMDKIDMQGQTADVLLDYLQKIDYISYYASNEDRMGNINSAIDQIRYRFKNRPVRENITEFFNNVALMSSADEKTEKNRLTLMTAHASKGTEFDAVILMGVNDGVLPISKATTLKSIEEERRIMYVAMTRARKHLVLTYALGFNYNRMENVPSRFLNDLNIVSTKEYNNIVGEIEAPEGFSEDNSSIKSGDLIYHKSFGEGTIISVEDSTFIAMFKPSIGTKELLTGHPSYFLKKNE